MIPWRNCCSTLHSNRADTYPEYRDSDNGDHLHVHLMLTMHAMDEKGLWLPKTKTAYVLDEDGERIREANGKWLRERMDTVDWNDQKHAEI